MLNPLQGGFQEHFSCMHIAFTLQEAIQSLHEHGKKTYVTYLDVRKAFDTVWHEGLLVKVHENGIKGQAWQGFIQPKNFFFFFWGGGGGGGGGSQAS